MVTHGLDYESLESAGLYNTVHVIINIQKNILSLRTANCIIIIGFRFQILSVALIVHNKPAIKRVFSSILIQPLSHLLFLSVH
jgi:hypothetical protein